MTRGTGGEIQRAARDHLDPHAEERSQEGKSALSLMEVARKALEAASAGVLSLLGVAWKVLKNSLILERGTGRSSEGAAGVWERGELPEPGGSGEEGERGSSMEPASR